MTKSVAHVSAATAALVVALVAVNVGAQRVLADFTGVWQIQAERSGPAVDVWGQTRAMRLVVTQSPTELSLETEGGGLSVPAEFQRYRLDGTTLEGIDNSLGDLRGFVRKVRTEARWDGERLTLLTEPFAGDRQGWSANAGHR